MRSQYFDGVFEHLAVGDEFNHTLSVHTAIQDSHGNDEGVRIPPVKYDIAIRIIAVEPHLQFVWSIEGAWGGADDSFTRMLLHFESGLEFLVEVSRSESGPHWASLVEPDELASEIEERARLLHAALREDGHAEVSAGNIVDWVRQQSGPATLLEHVEHSVGLGLGAFALAPAGTIDVPYFTYSDAETEGVTRTRRSSNNDSIKLDWITRGSFDASADESAAFVAWVNSNFDQFGVTEAESPKRGEFAVAVDVRVDREAGWIEKTRFEDRTGVDGRVIVQTIELTTRNTSE